jgi:hypothetical protein
MLETRYTKHYRNLQLWIEALISGDYKQGFGKLIQKDSDGNICHCATAVALEVFNFPKAFGRYYFGYEADDIGQLFSSEHAPDKWWKKTFPERAYRLKVQSMNDNGWAGFTGQNLSFYQIADYLCDLLPPGFDRDRLQARINHVTLLQAEKAERDLQAVS